MFSLHLCTSQIKASIWSNPPSHGAKKQFKFPTMDPFQVIKYAFFPRIYQSAKSADKSKIQDKAFLAPCFLSKLSRSSNLFLYNP